jgi:hypothetical protein
MTSAATPEFAPEAFDDIVRSGDLARLRLAAAGLTVDQLQALIDRAGAIRADAAMEYRMLGILARALG